MQRILLTMTLLALVSPAAPAQKGGGRAGGFGGGKPPSASFRGGAKPSAKPTQSNSVHGNSKASQKDQHMYGIYRTPVGGGKTETFKFGVSGGPTKASPQGKQQLSQRAENQVRSLNRKNDGYHYSSRILQRAPDRSSVLGKEKQAVTKHAMKKGDKVTGPKPPPGNKLPKPEAFSWVK